MKHLARWLIGAARRSTTLTYGEAKSRLEKECGFSSLARPGRAGLTAGTLQYAIHEHEPSAPLLNVLLVRQDTELPGSGAQEFLAARYPEEPRLEEEDADEIYPELWARYARLAAEEAYRYARWEALYEQLFGSYVPDSFYVPRKRTGGGGGGEGTFHKALREWVWKNPKRIDKRLRAVDSQTEVDLLSGDRVDVVYRTPDEVVAIEVKSRISDWDDFRRGIYQCVKYHAVVDAQEKEEKSGRRVRALLVTENSSTGSPRSRRGPAQRSLSSGDPWWCSPLNGQDGDQSRVCYGCIGDAVLSADVKQSGRRSLCTYCAQVREAVPLGELADRIHTVLEDDFILSRADDRHYVPSSPSGGLWEPDGDPVEHIIAEIAELEPEICEDLRELLSGRYAYLAATDGDDDPYDSDAHYVAKEPDDWDLRETWSAFCRQIRSRARFFSAAAEAALRSIFRDLDSHRTYDGRSVVLEISPTDEERCFWRARKAQSIEELKVILKSPTAEMGPPPSRYATGGRMNAQGIPVFYGAFDADTCVAEVRAPVGSHVVVAKFELLRPVRLLDFDALSEVYVPRSHFDPDYREQQGRAAFLAHLVREIGMPIMPQDEALEYLPTQAVAEFLANRTTPRFDGIVFRSTQTGQAGRNVVLFNHACGLVRSPLPDGAEVEVYVPSTREEDENVLGFVTIWESLPPEPAVDEKLSPERTGSRYFMPTALSVMSWDDPEWGLSDDPASDGEPALRLDDDSLVVREIRGVQYQSNSRKVLRSRKPKRRGVEF